MKRLIFLPLLMFSLPGFGAGNDDLNLIKQELMSLLQRIETLEAENRELKETVKVTASFVETASATKKTAWTDKLKVSGDLRTRYESIDAESKEMRERSRIRARVYVTAKPTDNTEIGIGLASGGDDPLSTNQTLGGGASTKDVRLDLAYFKWQAKPGLTLIGGKMKNMFFRPGGNGLLWDGDYRPEGLALTYKGDSFFVNSGLHFMESDTKRDNARIAYGLQTGYNGKVGDSKLIAGVSYFKFGAENRGAYYDDDFFGNSAACIGANCVYANDYEELELFAQFSTELADKPFTVFADYAQNQDATDLDTAWALGMKLGKASAPKTWEISYTYQDIEADSVFGLWNDSDFGGGGTDTRGHILRGAWAVNKKWKVGFTFFDNETGIDLGTERDYNRLQMDWAYKF